MLAARWIAAAVALGACGLESDYGGTAFRCEREGRCPAGYRCEDGICVTGGGPGDDAGPGTDAGPDDICGTSDALREEFAAIGPHWNADYIGTGAIEDGELVFRPANQTGFAILATHDSFLLRNSRYSVRVEPPVANQVPATDTLFIVDVRDRRKLQMRLARRNTLYFEIVSGDPEVTTFQRETPYQPADHAYWQIRHEGDAILWETSSDGADWVRQAEVAFEEEGRPSGVVLKVQTVAEGADPADSRVAFDDLNAGEPAVVPLCLASSLSDPFDGAALDAFEWDAGNFFEESDCATIVDRKLSVSGDCLVSSRRAFDMRGGSVLIEVPDPGPGDPDLIFGVQDTGSTATRFRLTEEGYESRQLLLEYTTGVVDIEPLGGMAFDAVAHRWWRIRHDAGAGSLMMGVSPDGSSWAAETQVAAPPDLSRVRFSIWTADWDGPLGTVAVDNFNRPP